MSAKSLLKQRACGTDEDRIKSALRMVDRAGSMLEQAAVILERLLGMEDGEVDLSAEDTEEDMEEDSSDGSEQ